LFFDNTSDFVGALSNKFIIENEEVLDEKKALCILLECRTLYFTAVMAAWHAKFYVVP